MSHQQQAVVVTNTCMSQLCNSILCVYINGIGEMGLL